VDLVGGRGSLFAALLGVALAVVVLRMQTDDAGAAPPPPQYRGTTSDGSAVTGDFIDGALRLNVRSPAGRCTPDGTVPAGFVSDRWLQEQGGFRHTGSFQSQVTVRGTTYPRTISFEFDGGISGDYIVGHMTRVDDFAGRRCIRESTFRLRKG
jgi:hypothetical protein